MENTKEVNVPERETSLHRAEQLNFPQIKVEQQVDETAMDKTMVKLETSICNSTIESIASNIDTYLDHKELKNESSNIYEDKIVRHEGTNVSVGDDVKEKPVAYIMEKVTATKVNRRVSARKTKKTNQLTEDKKENLKKLNPAKAMKQKAASRKTTKTSSKLLDLTKLLKQENEEPMENCAKVELYKINPAGCFKYTLPPFTSVRSETKMCDTKFSYPNVTRQQELNQYGSENNTNVLQHLDYNNLKYMNQQPVANSWMTTLKSDENFMLNGINSINNAQTEVGQNSYKVTNDKHHYAYTAVADCSWKQNENPYYNSFVNSTDSYKLFAENKVHYPCSVYGSNCIWNNMYMENFPRTNATFQQAAHNVVPNYVVPVNSSTNFLNPAAIPFHPFHCHQPLLMDDNLKKLYYPNLNSNGCELMVKKENAMPLVDNWYHPSTSMIPNNNSSNIPTSTWYNVAPSTSVDTSTSTISNVGKAELKCEQGTYFGNYYNADVTKANVYKDRFAPYVRPALESTLPAIDMHGLDPYKADNGLTGTFVQQNSTATNTNNGMISDIENPSSETNAVDPSEELHASCMYTKDKKLISKVLESIL